MLPNLMRSGFADKVWEVRLTWGEPRQPATLALRARPGLQQGSVFHLSRRKSSLSDRWSRWRGECRRSPSGHRGSCPRAPCQPWTARSPSLICKGSRISFLMSKIKGCWTIAYICTVRFSNSLFPLIGSCTQRLYSIYAQLKNHGCSMLTTMPSLRPCMFAN